MMKKILCFAIAVSLLFSFGIAEETPATPTDLGAIEEEALEEEIEEVVSEEPSEEVEEPEEEIEETEEAEEIEVEPEETEEEPEVVPEEVEEENEPEEEVEEEPETLELVEEVPEEIDVTISWEVVNGVYSPGRKIWNRNSFQYEDDPENPAGWLEVPRITCAIFNNGASPVVANFSFKNGKALFFEKELRGTISGGGTAKFSLSLGDGISVDVSKLFETNGDLGGTVSVVVTATE